MRKRTAHFALSVALAALAACAAGNRPSTGTRLNSSIMDSTEIRGHGYANVYDAIRAVHANWLDPVGGAGASSSSTAEQPVIGVFIEGVNRGNFVDYLKDLLPDDVKSVRRLSPTETLGTYGAPWKWGGVLVIRAR